MSKLVTVCVTALVVVAAVCVVVLAVMLVNMRTPRPELEIIPDYTSSRYISFDLGDPWSLKLWIEQLNDFIMKYEGIGWGDIDYSFVDVIDCSPYVPAGPGQVCKFDYQMLSSYCTKAEDWGYARKSPCVILKMNKILRWEPDVYRTIEEVEDSDMPSDLMEHIKRSTEDNGGNVPKVLWVSCKGETSSDEEYIGEFEYTPWQGFPAYYFPDVNTPGYLPPIVAVRFVAPATDIRINIVCKVYAKNIVHSDETEHPSTLHFSLHIFKEQEYNSALQYPSTEMSDESLLMIGIVCGVIVFIAGIGYLLICFILVQRRRRTQQLSAQHVPPDAVHFLNK